jgi:hypothetical protein
MTQTLVEETDGIWNIYRTMSSGILKNNLIFLRASGEGWGGGRRGRLKIKFYVLSLALTFMLSLLSWPQAAMMSLPLGVRTGLA